MSFTHHDIPHDVMTLIFQWSCAIPLLEDDNIISRRLIQHELSNLMLVCRAWAELAVRELYWDVYLVTLPAVQMFARTMASRRELWDLVKSLRMYDYAHLFHHSTEQTTEAPEGWNDLILRTLLQAESPVLSDPQSHVRSAKGLQSLRAWCNKLVLRSSRSQEPCDTTGPVLWHRLSKLQLRLIVNDQMGQIMHAINAISQLEHLVLIWDAEPIQKAPGRFVPSPGLDLPNLRYFSWDSTALGWTTLLLLNTAPLLATCRFPPSCSITLRGDLSPGVVPMPFFEKHALGSWTFTSVGKKDAPWLACALRTLQGQLTYSFRAFARATDTLELGIRLPPDLTLLDGAATSTDRRKVLACLAQRTMLSPHSVVHVRSTGRYPEILPMNAYNELQDHVESLKERNITLVVHP